jgi:hypothetical protein
MSSSGETARASPRERRKWGNRLATLVKPLLTHIFGDDAVTRGLADPEARMLVEWLVDHAERLANVAANEAAGHAEVRRLCRRARAIGRFVTLWCHQRERGAAVQLVAAERFTWPLPEGAVDPCELMQSILHAEASSFSA